MKDLILKNSRIELTVPYFDNELFSERFCSAAVIRQIRVDERFYFCEPEQRIKERVTCGGVGLCCEYLWNDLARECRRGEKFPKLGVGILTQIEDAKPYDMWRHYRVEPFHTSCEQYKNRILFTQENNLCNGVAAILKKEIRLEDDSIIISETIQNIGERHLEFLEYQHNFLSIDGMQVGPGYHLEVPFDKTLSDITDCVTELPDEVVRKTGVLTVSDQTIHWLRKMDGLTYYKSTPKKDIYAPNGYQWKLSHDNCPVAIRGEGNFNPARFDLWGIEHCVCPEVFEAWSIGKGECCSSYRKWHFESRR